MVNRYLCSSPVFIRWKRKHRKARIDKKWRKRYGAVYEYCKGVCYEVRGIGMVMCPCVKAKLDKEFG